MPADGRATATEGSFQDLPKLTHAPSFFVVSIAMLRTSYVHENRNLCSRKCSISERLSMTFQAFLMIFSNGKCESDYEEKWLLIRL